MNWLDVLIIITLVVAVIVETMRGFGRAVFAALALFGVLWLASTASGPISHAMPLSSDPGVAKAYAYGILAVGGTVVGLMLSHFAYASMLLHAGMFDHFLGLVLGVCVGMMLSHGMVRSMALSDPDGKGSAQVVMDGPVSSEMYDFHNYHTVVDQITGAANNHRELNLP